jgi:hypothetical protein
MTPRFPSGSPEFEPTEELPLLQFGTTGQPVTTAAAARPVAGPADETATWVSSASPSDHRDLRIAELERELAKLRATLSEREALLRQLRAQAAGSSPVTGRPTAPESSAIVGSASSRVLVSTAGDSGITHVLGRRTTIGRTPENDIWIDSPGVSRHHAVLLTIAADTCVEDLHSANGVYVNGKRVTRQVLADGDILDVGESRFRFVLRRN